MVRRMVVPGVMVHGTILVNREILVEVCQAGREDTQGVKMVITRITATIRGVSMVLALVPGIKSGSNHRGHLGIYAKILYLWPHHRGTAILLKFLDRRRLRVR